MNKSILVLGGTLFSLMLLPGCRSNTRAAALSKCELVPPPAMMRPFGGDGTGSEAIRSAVYEGAVADLDAPEAVVWGETPVEILETSMFDPQIIAEPPGSIPPRRVKEILPAHNRVSMRDIGPENDLPVGGLIEARRAAADALWPGIGQTGWVPPDPTLAVGPTHVVTTVNQRIAFYTRAGVLEFQVELNWNGNPGFFETVGARGFTFDPKCFYDHYAQRFVVVAPEVYTDTQEAWICIAVSDDDNPHGTWFKYRTDAVISAGATTYWWDYPGFGYDQQAYYVTGNLFGLNAEGWGGVGFRVFDKASMLGGGTAQYATLRDGSAGSVQVAQHFGDNLTPYFVSLGSSSALRIHALRNALTNPQLISTTVSVPSFNYPSDAPSVGADPVQLIDARIMNVHWRDGNLYAAHHIAQGGRNFARWYHLRTNSWPEAGGISFIQAGNIDAGGDLHSWFPAIYSNQQGSLAVVFGTSSATQRISVNATGRLVNDPLGTMGAIEVLRTATRDGGGRWGDYYDVALDPTDNSTFWVIGEYPAASGWQTWISSFTINAQPLPYAVADDAGGIFQGASIAIDVLANDYHSGGLEFFISEFESTSQHGGTIMLSEATGPGGRDELIYIAPANYVGPDSFAYSIRDAAQQSSSAAVSVQVFDPAEFREPDQAGVVQSGLEASYYALSSPSSLPDFSILTPYALGVVSSLNYAATSGVFAGSGRSDEVGAVFEGFLRISELDIYALYLSSDDGSKLYLGDHLLIDNDGLHGMTERSAAIGLKPGLHRLRVEFFENAGSAGLIVSLSGTRLVKQPIPATSWLRPTDCPGDISPDGSVNLTDLAVLLGHYGLPAGATYQNGDLDGDGDVDLADLAYLLGAYGTACD